MNIRALISAAAVALLVVGAAATIPATRAQTVGQAVDTTPSRKTLDDADQKRLVEEALGELDFSGISAGGSAN